MADTPWSGFIAPYNVPTGDSARTKRMFRPGTIAFRQTPFPLYWQRETGQGGHGGSVIVGRVDYVDTDDPQGIFAAGVIYDAARVPEAERAEFLLREKVIGPSVDLDDSDFEVYDQFTGAPVDPNCAAYDTCPTHQVFVPSQARVAGVTLVGIPAFAEMGHSLELGDPADPFDDGDEFCATCPDEHVSSVNADFGGFAVAGRAHAWNAAEAAARVRELCTRDGELDVQAYGRAFLVQEGVPGDPDAYRFPIADVVGGQLALVPAGVRSAAARLDQSGLGEDRKVQARTALEGVFTTLAEHFDDDSFEAPWCAAPAAVVASAGGIFTDVPAKPYEAFNLKATEPTPVMILDSGQFWGHLALWDTPHRGFAEHGVDFFCPRSKKRYEEFLVGATRTTQGIIPTGKLVLGGGHADGALSIQRARRWYDEHGAGMAEINIVEDEFGPFMCGWLLPGVDAHAADEIFRSPPSGDWRWDKGVRNYELVGVIGVNVPAFPVPRVRVVNGHAFSVMGAGIPWHLYQNSAPAASLPAHAAEFTDLLGELRAAELGNLLEGMKA